jgi:UDP-N-acetyl-D-mannosaminuronic acid transferase (WecB/TagA/CpsF family)
MRTQSFLGITFWNDSVSLLLETADREGGLFTVPSAPSLAMMTSDAFLAKAYQSSDFAVVDGGYVALVLRFVFGKSVNRISGLQLLQKLFAPDFTHAVPMEQRRILWVVPNGQEKDAIRNYLLGAGFDLNQQDFYEAPFYRKDEDFQDGKLHQKVRTVNPHWIILCIGGGRQEKLGMLLRDAFNVRASRPVILCTGGAISFLSGTQANIPTWADRLYLGWFLRILTNPKLFGARYLEAAWRFPKLIWMCRRSLFEQREPPSKTTGSDSISGTEDSN